MRVAVVSAQTAAVIALTATELAIVETGGGALIPEPETGWLATHHVSAVELTNRAVATLAAAFIAGDRGCVRSASH
jgi:hypothetical protein